MILTRLSKKDFDKILSHYDIGKYKSHKYISRALENTVYLLKTNKGKFILKIYESSEPKRIRFELEVKEFLRKKKLPVPQIMETKTGDKLFKYKGKNMTVERFVEGRELEKLNRKMIISAAKTMALMHKEMSKLKIKCIWRAYHFEPYDGGVQRILDFDFKREENKFLREFRKINKKRLRKCIIHGDFHSVNLLSRNNRIVAILDWADMHKTFLVYDLAIFIAHSLIGRKKVEKEKIRLFLRTYQKEAKLNIEEKKAMYYLMKHRLLGAILWCSLQAKRHLDHARGLYKEARRLIQCYKNLDQMSLEEFLKLF